ncbi:MAG: type II secretion system minor pseudopilin GspJ, partial [Gammaproteobacteria bacterium]|nr:type II secretion system minor pseudopilin GspJ [Gammaproteobacteria bacterium]
MANRRDGGLTLIEFLIAVAVFAVLSALAYSGLNNVLLTSSHARAESDRLTRLQMTMRYLQRDIDQIVNRRVRDQYGDQRPPLESTVAAEEAPLLSFTRAGWTNPAG